MKKQSNKHIGAIILGAGQSKRMGMEVPKLLLPLKGCAIFQYPLQVAKDAGLSPIIFVAGEHFTAFKQQVGMGDHVDMVYNPDFKSGMASSLKLGVKTVTSRTHAVLVFLADQPLVTTQIVHSLITAYETMKEAGILIVRPSYAGQLGHPILFSEKLFSDFESINGDVGGKHIIKKHKENVHIVPFDNHILGTDIDTPNDLQVVRQYLNTYK